MSVCVSLCHFMSLSDLLPLSRCKVTKSKFGTVTFCHYLSPFVTFQQIAFSRCKVTEKKFDTVRICPHMSGNVHFCPHFFFAAKLRKEYLAMSVCVSLCHFMSLSDLLPLSRCKVTKRKFGTVTFCHYLSPFVTFQQIAFSRCKVTEKKFGTVRICPEMSAFVRISFSMQSYEIEIWHCPNLSNYVQICPFYFVAISLSP